MKLLVIGGTGTLGRQIVRRALDEGHEVYCLVRSFQRGGFLREWGAQLLRGNLCSPQTLPPALEGVEAVIDAATARPTDAIDKVDWDGKLNLIKAAKAAGADALLVATPPYAYPTGREIALHALAIDRAANLPVMLYNYPGRMSVDMDEDTLDRVGRSPNFCAIKESSGDINRVHLLARDYPHIQLGCGMDDQALEFFAWGAPFWVCGGSNFLPKEHIALYNACVVEGNFTKGRRIMSAMLPLMRVLEQGGKFIQTIKYGVTMNGIPAEDVRAPLKGLNKDDKRALEQVVRVIKRTVADIEAEG